jgi:hypothetical protein
LTLNTLLVRVVSCQANDWDVARLIFYLVVVVISGFQEGSYLLSGLIAFHDGHLAVHENEFVRTALEGVFQHLHALSAVLSPVKSQTVFFHDGL